MKHRIWIIAAAAIVLIGILVKVGLVGAFWRGFLSGLGYPSIDLSVEITKDSAQGPRAHFGYVRITNLAEEPIILKRVLINHRKDEGCSFGDGTNSSPLAQGSGVTLGSGTSLLGGCGSIIVVTVETDKGGEDYTINW
jgi:hypothetical protein